MPTKALHGSETDLLAAARAGDELAFRRLIEPHYGELCAVCYRLLGSWHDAEDATQEALVRGWRALPRFDGRSRVRTWLYRIATNVCLDALANRRKRLLPMDYGPPVREGTGASSERFDSEWWIEPFPDEFTRVPDDAAGPAARAIARETIELSFVAALQHLPPRQRCVLVLRDVLSFSASEVAEMLSTTPTSVNSALQRAREAIEQRVPEGSQQENLRRLGDARLGELVSDPIDRFERGEVEAILAMLADDARFSMPPYAAWYQGRDRLAESWLIPDERPTGLRFLPTRANGQIALGVYKLDRSAARPTGRSRSRC